MAIPVNALHHLLKHYVDGKQVYIIVHVEHIPGEENAKRYLFYRAFRKRVFASAVRDELVKRVIRGTIHRDRYIPWNKKIIHGYVFTKDKENPQMYHITLENSEMGVKEIELETHYRGKSVSQ